MLAEFLNGDIRGSKPISLLCNQEGAGTESVDQHEAALFLGGGGTCLDWGANSQPWCNLRTRL